MAVSRRAVFVAALLAFAAVAQAGGDWVYRSEEDLTKKEHHGEWNQEYPKVEVVDEKPCPSPVPSPCKEQVTESYPSPCPSPVPSPCKEQVTESYPSPCPSPVPSPCKEQYNKKIYISKPEEVQIVEVIKEHGHGEGHQWEGEHKHSDGEYKY